MARVRKTTKEKEGVGIRMIRAGKFAARTLAAVLALVMMGCVTAWSRGAFAPGSTAEEALSLAGHGTREDPFLIGSMEDLCELRDAVNAGESFDDQYFLQTCDLDLAGEAPWEPIGLYGSGRYFYGVYDGGNRKIYDLICYPDSAKEVNNVCLFGQLGGVVINLGIESGSIEGDFVGSFASHSIGGEAAIINCYNRASVTGAKRAGGICDCFTNGVVANCVNRGAVSGKVSAQIVSYSAASVINVSPAENAVAHGFSGAVMNCIPGDAEDIFAWLNEGLDYLRSAGAMGQYDLKYWQVERG